MQLELRGVQMDKIQVQKSLCAASLLAMLSVGAPAMAENGSADGLTINNYISRTSHAPATRNIVHDGIFDTVNGEIEETTLENWTADTAASIMFDADLANGTSDGINVTGTAAGSVKLMGINIFSDSTTKTSTLALFKNGVSPDIDVSDYTQYTNNYKYTVSKGNPGEITLTRYDIRGGFNNALADTGENRTFSATSNIGLTDAGGAMAGTNLTVFGNSYDFTYTSEMPAYTPLFTAGAGQSIYLDGVRVLGLKNNRETIYMTDAASAVIKNSYFGYNNGGMTFERTPVMITNTVFDSIGRTYGTSDNSAGALWTRSESKIADSTFINNRVVNTDGGMVYGGAVGLIGSSNIFNTTFENNYAHSPEQAFGGAMYINGSFTGDVNIYDSTFTGNRTESGNANGTGGAIRAGQTLYLYNTAFSGNKSDLGGAINSTWWLYVNESVFSGNSATQNGGAIYLAGTALTTTSPIIGNTTFSGNTAQNGAAIFVNNANLTVGSSVFGGDTAEMGNIASGNGGAIYVKSGTVDVYDSLFKHNQANMGSAIYVESGTVNVQNSTFDANTSVSHGIIHTDSGTVNVKNSSFLNNSMGGQAAISAVTGSLNVENSHFSGNLTSANAAIDTTSRLSIINSVFENNASTQMGVVGTSSKDSVIKNSIFKNNTVAAGAISNYSMGLTIIADGGKVEFSGNGVGIANRATNPDSGVYLNASKSGSFIINDDIRSDFGNFVSINSVRTLFDGTSAPTDGNIQMNGKFIGSNVVLDGGSLTLGEFAQISDGYFENSSLTINNGTLNTANGVADTLELNDFTANGGEIVIDLAGADKTHDKFNVSGTAAGNLTIGAINVVSELSDPTNSTKIDLFLPDNSPTLTVSGNTYTNNILYTFTPSATPGAVDIYQTDISNSIYNAVSGTTNGVQFAEMGGNTVMNSQPGTGASGWLFIDGNNYDLDMSGRVFNNHNLNLVIRNVGLMDGDTVVNAIHGISADNGFTLFHISGNSLLLENSVLANNSWTNPGAESPGVIWGGNITLKNSYFINNHNLAGSGQTSVPGAFTLLGNNRIIGSVFRDNSASNSDSGTIYLLGSSYIDSSEFVNNTSQVGGVLNTHNHIDNSVDSYTYITNSTFRGNSATNATSSAGGGAIYNSAYNYLFISDSEFTENTSGACGGAIYSYGDFSIFNTKFNNNYTTGVSSSSSNAVGGSIMASGANFYIGASDFTGNPDNTANTITQAGALSAFQSVGYIDNSKFSNNFAKNNAGAFNVNASDITIYNSVFESNKTGGNGGAIYFIDSGNTNIFDSVFTGNSATSGGAINFSSNSIATTHIFGTEFTGNTGSTRGGAIYAYNSDLYVTSSTFTDNTTAVHGGAIYTEKGDFELVVMDSAFSAAGTGSNGIRGGAIYAGTGTTNTIISSTFDSHSVQVSDSDNTGGYGGAIYSNGSSSVYVNTSSFTNNTAEREGGAWGVSGENSTAFVHGSVFSGNKVVPFDESDVADMMGFGQGGAIFTNAGNDMTISNSVFGGNDPAQGNTAVFGGAIGNKCNLSIYNTSFLNNSANVGTNFDNSGGAIYNFTTGELNIGNTAFTGNTVNNTTATEAHTGAGGAIYNLGTAVIGLSSFTNNSVTMQNGSSLYSIFAGSG